MWLATSIRNEITEAPVVNPITSAISFKEKKKERIDGWFLEFRLQQIHDWAIISHVFNSRFRITLGHFILFEHSQDREIIEKEWNSIILRYNSLSKKKKKYEEMRESLVKNGHLTRSLDDKRPIIVDEFCIEKFIKSNKLDEVTLCEPILSVEINDKDELVYSFNEATVPPKYKRGEWGKTNRYYVLEKIWGYDVYTKIKLGKSFKNATNWKETDINGNVIDDVLVYIHGIRTDIKKAITTSAQLKLDLNFPGVVVAIEWEAPYFDGPEEAKRIAGKFAGLRALLHNRKSYIIAHSMGNHLMYNLVDYLECTWHTIISASPAVELSFFSEWNGLKQKLGDSIKRIIVYHNHKDVALVCDSIVNAIWGDSRFILGGIQGLTRSASNSTKESEKEKQIRLLCDQLGPNVYFVSTESLNNIFSLNHGHYKHLKVLDHIHHVMENDYVHSHHVQHVYGQFYVIDDVISNSLTLWIPTKDDK